MPIEDPKEARGEPAPALPARSANRKARAFPWKITVALLVVAAIALVAAIIVCWKFDLQPHWALAVLAARELAMLVLSQAALRRGREQRTLPLDGAAQAAAELWRDLP